MLSGLYKREATNMEVETSEKPFKFQERIENKELSVKTPLQVSQKNQNENKENIKPQPRICIVKLGAKKHDTANTKEKRDNNTYPFNCPPASVPLLEYISEIYYNITHDSEMQTYSFSSMSSVQQEITPKMRAILIDWLISLHYHFRLEDSSLFATINIIDRYLSIKSIQRNKFQLLGVSALFIGVKYDEIYCPSARQLNDMTDSSYSPKEIVEMEKEILSTLNYNLTIPNQFDIYQLMSMKYKLERKDYFFGLFILELYALDASCTKYLPYVISEAACFLVMKIYPKESYTNLININSNKELKECANEMLLYCREAVNSSLKGVLKKFASEKYMRISDAFGFFN